MMSVSNSSGDRGSGRINPCQFAVAPRNEPHSMMNNHPWRSLLFVATSALVCGCQREAPPRYQYAIVNWGRPEWVSSPKADKLYYHESPVIVADAANKRYKLVLVMLPDEDAIRERGVLVLKDPISVTGDHIYDFNLYGR
jgi:hypothetical protein